MKIEQRGTPPYIIMSAGIPEIPEGHPGYRDDFGGALEVIFYLTGAGLDGPGPQQTKPERIIDSKGNVVFSADNPNDIKLLRQIDEVGFLGLEVIPSKAD